MITLLAIPGIGIACLFPSRLFAVIPLLYASAL